MSAREEIADYLAAQANTGTTYEEMANDILQLIAVRAVADGQFAQRRESTARQEIERVQKASRDESELCDLRRRRDEARARGRYMEAIGYEDSIARNLRERE